MSSLIGKLVNELLDSELDLSSCAITQEHDGALTVTSRLRPVRLLFAAVFALPCIYFLIYLLGNPGMVNLAIALVFCPVMAALALLIGGAIAMKSIDLRRRQATKSLRLLSFSKTALEPLASRGTVILTWKWSKSGDQTKGYSKYTATVSPGKGLAFVALDDYATARDFAERLASFLRFPLENRVPDANRK